MNFYFEYHSIKNLSRKLDLIHKYLIISGFNGIKDTHSVVSVKMLKASGDYLIKINRLSHEIKELFNSYEVNLSKRDKLDEMQIHSCEFAFDVLKSMLLSCNIPYKIIHKQDGNYLLLVTKNSIDNTFECIDKYPSCSDIAYDIAIENYSYLNDLIVDSGSGSVLKINNNEIKIINTEFPVDYTTYDETDLNNIKNAHFIVNSDTTNINIINNSDSIIKSTFIIGGDIIWVDDLPPNSNTNIIKLHTILIPYLKYHSINIKFTSENAETEKAIGDSLECSMNYMKSLGLDFVSLPLRDGRRLSKNVLRYASGMCCIGFSN